MQDTLRVLNTPVQSLQSLLRKASILSISLNEQVSGVMNGNPKSRVRPSQEVITRVEREESVRPAPYNKLQVVVGALQGTVDRHGPSIAS